MTADDLAWDVGSGSGEVSPPPPPLAPPLAPPPTPPDEWHQGLVATAITFFSLIAALAALVWLVGELKRRTQLRRQRADAEYLLHTTTLQGAGEDESVRDYAPHNNM